VCTPSYAVRLAKVADQKGLADALSTVTKIICTGEPGASLPAVRSQIEALWDARCLDHAGMSEVGAFGYPCVAGGGVHINEREFVIEIVAPGSEDPVGPGEVGELIVTAIGRKGFPTIRYRTGDVVECCEHPCPADHADRWFPGGILGRTDDMVVIRGMNVFPSSGSMVISTPAVANALGSPPETAPGCSANRRSTSRSASRTTSWSPAPSKFVAIGRPIRPRPMNPTVSRRGSCPLASMDLLSCSRGDRGRAGRAPL
jgi:acyl-coenzyme A synthetase/AMP-(fatty) acid ligase